MSITDSLKRRIGRPPMPTGPDLAPSVQAKIDDATARIRAIQQDIPAASLDAVQEVEGAADRLAGLQSQLAAVGAELATLQHAFGEAEQVDKRKWAQQRAAIHRSSWLAVKKHLEARDAAAQTMSVSIENAVQAYREMVEAADKAMRAGQVLASQNLATSGHRLAQSELYKAASFELFRLGTPWPVQPGDRTKVFPFDKSVTSQIRGEAGRPLAEELRQRSADLLAELDGSEIPKFDQ
jgi:hypothetical protein